MKRGEKKKQEERKKKKERWHVSQRVYKAVCPSLATHESTGHKRRSEKKKKKRKEKRGRVHCARCSCSSFENLAQDLSSERVEIKISLVPALVLEDRLSGPGWNRLTE